MDQPKPFWQKWAPFLIAIAIALMVVIYYVVSGRSSMDLNLRQLEKSTQIERTVATGDNTVVIKCKNGESYQIVYKAGQTNFQDLVYNKCGAEGGTEQIQ